MSIEALAWAWTQDVPNASAKLVLLALADHANGDGYCWPAMTRIAVMTGLSDRQVSRHVTTLAELGLVIKADRRRSAGGGFRGWTYLVGPQATTGHERLVATGHERPVASRRPRPVYGTVRENRKEDLDAAKPRVKADLLFEAVVAVCGHDPAKLTGSERGRINKALKDLRTAGATPEQVRAAAPVWRRRYPEAQLTSTALAAHWSTLVSAAPATVRDDVCPICSQPIAGHDAEICAVFDDRR